jgi:hypothetical protein
MKSQISISCLLLFTYGFAHAGEALMRPKAFENYDKTVEIPSWKRMMPGDTTFPSPSGTPSPAPNIPPVPPYNPCSSTSSCAPGVGLESGATIEWQNQMKIIDESVQK